MSRVIARDWGVALFAVVCTCGYRSYGMSTRDGAEALKRSHASWSHATHAEGVQFVMRVEEVRS